MNSANKNIPAFTILEMMIVLAISSIIISMVYFTYTMLTKQLYIFSNENIEINNYTTINKQIKNDFFNCVAVKSTKNELVLTMREGNTIQYSVVGKTVQRKTNTTEEKLPVYLFSHNFRNTKPLLANKTYYCTFDFDVLGEKITCTYSKNLGIKAFINTYFLNGN